MKSTKHFKNTILGYLEERAKCDELFAVSFAKQNKNIDNCITYILNTVKNSKCNGFCDDEIYSMAIHYYVEDNIEVGKPINCSVAVNHVIELTYEEKQEARKEAIKKLEDETYNSLKKKPTKKRENTEVKQMSLF